MPHPTVLRDGKPVPYCFSTASRGEAALFYRFTGEHGSPLLLPAPMEQILLRDALRTVSARGETGRIQLFYQPLYPNINRERVKASTAVKKGAFSHF